MPLDNNESTTIGLGNLQGLLVIIGVAVLDKYALVRVEGDFDDEQRPLDLPRPRFDGELLLDCLLRPPRVELGVATARVFFRPAASWL